jgi:ABC-2 type transport system permease protein
MQSKQGYLGLSDYVSIYFTAVLGSIVFAWLARQSNTPTISTYLLVGVPLLGISSNLIAAVGWSLASEVNRGTLEFAMISPTSMITMIVGKTLANMIIAFTAAIISFATMFIITRSPLTVANGALLPFSLMLAFTSIFITSLFFSPLMILARGRGGFFNVFTPFVAVLSGFVYPISELPTVLNILARCLPASWAMDAIWKSIEGTTSVQQIIASLGMCILVSAIWLMVIYFMFKIVEKRIRVTGTLGTY